MSKARQLADNGAATPNRNKVINGSMTVSQRATSVTGVSSAGYHTCDRYRAAFTRAEYVCTVSQDTSAPSGFANSYKIATTTAESALSAGDQINISHRFEGQNLQNIAKGTSAAKQLTLSFWVKSSIATTWTSDLYDADNARQCSKTYTTDVVNTWEYKTITFPADTTGAFGNDNGGSLYLRWWLDAGTDWTSGTQATEWAGAANATTVYAATGFMTTGSSTWQITGVQLEVGPAATPFEHKTFAEDLAECQRYYYKTGPLALNDTFCLGFNGSATVAVGVTHYPVTMRADPTAVEQNGTAAHYRIAHASTSTACSAVPSFDRATIDSGSTVFTVGSGLTTGQAVECRSLNGTAFLAWSAEL